MSVQSGYTGVNIILGTGFSDVKHNVQFRDATKRKGEKLVESHHVTSVHEFRKADGIIIQGFCIRQTSVNAPPYHVQIDIDYNRNVTNVSCCCVTRSRKRCKHIYALLHYIKSDRSLSQTSFEQQWGKPLVSQLSKLMYSKGKKCSELFPQKINVDDDNRAVNFSPEDFTGLNCAASNIILLESKNSLEKENRAAAMRAEKERKESVERECIVACARHFIESFCSLPLYGEKFFFCNEYEKEYFESNIALCEDEIIELCYRTRNQRECQEWNYCRRLRITASTKAHRIKQLKRKSEESLAEELLTARVIKNKNLEYGIVKENIAINEYKTTFQVEVYKIGHFVPPLQPWLGISIDGAVSKDNSIVKLLEIKCPISCKKKPIWDEVNNESNVSYLILNNGKIELKSNHSYYTQIQMQMYCTGITECDLYIWSPVGSCKVEVHRDDVFLSLLLPTLTTFYFNSYLPALCNNDCNKENSPKNSD